MSQQSPLSQWVELVSTHLPKLSRPQARVLAYWSFGMVLARSCGITLVCAALALQLGCSEASLLQRLREWCYSAKDKKGHKRRELDVSTCFGPLLQWILAWWPADEPRLALALDATTLGKRFPVLVISVVYRGCAIPVAWKVVGALEKGAWEPHWLKLLEQLRDSVPAHWTVIVMSDRGLYARLSLCQDRLVGLAPLYAHQQTRQFPSKRRSQVSQSGHGCPQRRQCLVWSGGLLLTGDQSLAVYVAGSASMRATRKCG